MSNSWMQALKKFNEGKKTWCIPKKGSPQYYEVMAMGKDMTEKQYKKEADEKKKIKEEKEKKREETRKKKQEDKKIASKQAPKPPPKGLTEKQKQNLPKGLQEGILRSRAKK